MSPRVWHQNGHFRYQTIGQRSAEALRSGTHSRPHAFRFGNFAMKILDFLSIVFDETDSTQSALIFGSKRLGRL